MTRKQRDNDSLLFVIPEGNPLLLGNPLLHLFLHLLYRREQGPLGP
jgi:hypothetical protein